jgi:outer membrane biosynthesis protein TonB
MRTGAMVSAILHVSIILLTVVGFPFLMPEITPTPVIDIEFVEIGEMTNVRETVKADDKPPTPEPKPEPEETEIPPQELALAPDTPSLTVDKLPEPPPEPEPPKPEEAKKPEPPKEKPKEKPKKKEEFDVDQVMKDLLAQAPEAKPETQSDKTRERVGAGTAQMSTQRDAIAGMLRSQVERCWSPPIGAPNAEQLIVSLEVSLGPDGAVRGLPQVVDTTRLGDTYYRAAAEAAQRAVMQCSPYQLPAEYYDVWKAIKFNMDPREILG